MKIKYFIALILVLPFLFSSCKKSVSDALNLNETPKLYPDYVGVTIPTNIAPLNFQLDKMDGVDWVDVVVEGSVSGDLHISTSRLVEFDKDEWKELLKKNVGERLTFKMSILKGDKWYSYKPFYMYVSKDKIDYSVVYRRLSYGYEAIGEIGMYESPLETYDEIPIIRGGCFNCHTSNRNDPRQSTWHFRSSDERHKGATAVIAGDSVCMLNSKTKETNGGFVYGYWHPSGRYIAYSLTSPSLFVPLHQEIVDEFDKHADIVIYDVKTNEIITDKRFATKDFFNAPSFSPDGKTMYFSYTKYKYMPANYKEIDYDLLSVSFDEKTGKLGDKIDTLFKASSMGKSVSFARPSYDGKYVLFALCGYGMLSVYNKDSDLWLYDVRTRKARPITEVNSDQSESFHNWSSNSKWIVITSRRDDGYYARLYFSHIDENGKFSKPFMMPKKDPKKYYGTLTSTYNVPEFLVSPIPVSRRELKSRIFEGKRKNVKVRH